MTPFVQVAGWTLIHFIWQGAVAGLLTHAALTVARGRSAQARYAIACAGLAAALAMPMVTAALLLPADAARATHAAVLSADPVSRSLSLDRADDGAASAASGVIVPENFAIAASRFHADDAIRGVVILWVIGVALLLGRMAAGWWQVRELHQRALETPASVWQPSCARIATRLALSRIAHVVESAVVEVPTVVGWLRPVIILPVAAIASLTPSQVEAILAHELAHIRRHDYLVNVAQTLAETLLFYHPAVWWMSSRIRIEREHCCDEVAVAICGDAIGYAEALTELESWRTASTMMALAATGGSLVNRVRRILRIPAADEPRSSSWIATLSLTLLFTAGAGGVQRLPTMMSSVSARAAAIVGGSTGSSAVSAIAAHEAALPSHHKSTVAPASSASDDGGLEVDGSTAADIEDTDADEFAAQTVPPSGDDRDWTVPLPPPPPSVPPAPPVPPAPQAVQAPPAPSSPPAPPSAPAPPAPPAPPAAPADASGFSLSGGHGDWHMQWSSNGARLDVTAHGEIAFTDDLSDVQSMGDGGYLKIRDWTSIVPHTVEITSSGGKLSRAYFVGGASRPWDDDARRALATDIAVLVRRSGMGAETRTRTILEKKGVAGVLAEIDQLQGDYVRRIYFQTLIKQARLNTATVLPVLEKINDRMTSDFDRRQILTSIAQTVPLDSRGASVYIQVVEAMRSDFDRREALSAVLNAKPLAPGVADLALRATAAMHSDFERRQIFHAALAAGASVERADALLPAIASMQSSFDKREVLTELIRTGSLGVDAKRGVLRAAGDIASDFDKRTVLTSFAQTYGVDQTTRDAYFAAVKTMRSDYDRAESLLLLVRSAGVDASMRPAFVDAAQSLTSTYDQDRVLAALVRSERR